MAELVNVRSTKGKRKQFLVDKRLAEKYPDDYEVVEPKKPAAKTPAKPRAKTARKVTPKPPVVQQKPVVDTSTAVTE